MLSGVAILLIFCHAFALSRFVFRVPFQQWSGGRRVVLRKCSVHGKLLYGYPCCYLSLNKEEYSQLQSFSIVAGQKLAYRTGRLAG